MYGRDGKEREPSKNEPNKYRVPTFCQEPNRTELKSEFKIVQEPHPKRTEPNPVKNRTEPEPKCQGYFTRFFRWMNARSDIYI